MQNVTIFLANPKGGFYRESNCLISSAVFLLESRVELMPDGLRNQ